MQTRLVHSADESVDSLATVTSVAALGVVGELLALEAAVGVRELEGPEEVGDGLEVGAAGGDLVDNVFDGEDAELAEVLLNNLVVVDGETLAVDLGVTTLVDQLADGLEVGCAVGDVRLDELEHLRGGLGQSDKDTVVDLEETQELQNLAWLGGNVVDTTETDDEDDLGLAGNVEVALGLGGTAKTDLLALGGAVLLGVLLGTLEDDLALGEVGLLIGQSQIEVEGIGVRKRFLCKGETWCEGLDPHRNPRIASLESAISSQISGSSLRPLRCAASCLIKDKTSAPKDGIISAALSED